MDIMAKTIIGVDGSDNSRVALNWAIAHSEPGDELVAVGAWTYPAAAADAALYAPGLDLEADLEKRISVLVDAVAAQTGRSISIHVGNGHAGRILTDLAQTADLLVVGNRGHGGFAGLLLGSVSTYCVHHAQCPTVVVPTPAE